MKVKIVQLDGTLMNRALGCIARDHVNKGDQVSFNEQDPDLIYYSAIYTRTAKLFEQQQTISKATVVRGGYPFSDQWLAPEIDALMPYYSLWGVDYSLGYTSRGCPRNCSFCIIPQKEGNIRNYQPVSQFHDPNHRRIILLDNNFLASPQWKANASYIEQQGLQVCFCQGLDVRLLNEENVKIVADLKYSNPHWTHHMLTLAFDSITIAPAVRHGIELLLANGVKRENIQFFVLTGYDETVEQERERCRILWEDFGVLPFVMLFDNTKDAERRSLARYYNKRVMKVCKFEDYVEARKHAPNYAESLDQW